MFNLLQGPIPPLPGGNETLAVAVPSILAAIFGFLKWYLPWHRKSIVKRKSVKELRTIQRIYTIMHEMVAETSAERIIVFAGHDSGSSPKAGSPYYVSSIYWKVRHDACRHDVCVDVKELDSKTHSDIADYKEVSVDEHYIEMLLELEDKGTVHYKTEDLPEDSQIRDFYDMEGVTESIITFLGYQKTDLLYMSAASFANDGFSEDDEVRLKLKSAKIKRELGFL